MSPRVFDSRQYSAVLCRIGGRVVRNTRGARDAVEKHCIKYRKVNLGQLLHLNHCHIFLELKSCQSSPAYLMGRDRSDFCTSGLCNITWQNILLRRDRAVIRRLIVLEKGDILARESHREESLRPGRNDARVLIFISMA